MVGQRPDQADRRWAEGVDLSREGPERPEDLAARDERGHDHRPDPDVADDAVRFGRMGEGVVIEVVAGHHHRPVGDRASEHADPDGQVDGADPGPAAAASDAGVVGEAQMTRRRIDDVDHRAIGIQQARGLVDGGLEQLVDLADAAVRIGSGRLGCPVRAVGRGHLLGRGSRGSGRATLARCPGGCRHGPRIPGHRERWHRRSPMAATSSGRGGHRRATSRRHDL